MHVARLLKSHQHFNTWENWSANKVGGLCHRDGSCVLRFTAAEVRTLQTIDLQFLQTSLPRTNYVLASLDGVLPVWVFFWDSIKTRGYAGPLSLASLAS